MASNPMQRKVRNSFLLGLLVMLVITIIIGVLVFFVVVKPKMEEKQEEEQQLYAYAYRLKTGVNVKSGEEITSSMVESVEIPIQTAGTDFIPSKNQSANGKLTDVGFVGGYKSKLDLTAGTILTYSMLYEEDETPDSLRYVEYNMITIPTTLDVGDYIDIRLRLVNGQDLIVVSKKEIMSIYEQTIGLNLTEDEIVILNSAIVEAYIMTASELYVSMYVEPGLQEAAIYTYMPTAEVITLINMNENIISDARTALARLYAKQGTTDVRNQINNSLSQYGEDARYNVEAGIQEQIEAARKAREDYLSELEGY